MARTRPPAPPCRGGFAPDPKPRPGKRSGNRSGHHSGAHPGNSWEQAWGYRRRRHQRHRAGWRRRAVCLVLALVLLLGLPGARPGDRASTASAWAAGTLPYTLAIAAPDQPALAAALRNSSELAALRTTAAVGPFALIQRARQDEARFLSVLHSFGYYKAAAPILIGGRPLDSPGLLAWLEQVPEAPPVTVTVTFAPGPLFRLGEVRLAGTVPEPARAALGLAPGAPARAADVLAARARVLAALRAAGYALAKVTLEPATLYLDRDRMDVTFAVASGPRVALGPIRFTGTKDVNPEFLSRHIALRPGDPFSPTAIEQARAALLALPALSFVRAEPARALDAEGRLPLTFHVGERQVHAVELGAEYSTDLGVGLSAAWVDRNLFGNAEQLRLGGAVATGGTADIRPGYRLDARYSQPDFRVPGRTLELAVGAVDETLLPYSQKALTQSVRLERTLGPHWRLGYGIAGEEETIVQQDVSRVYYLLQFPLTLGYDNTDSLLVPTRGLRALLRLVPTQSVLGHGAEVLGELTGAAYLDLSGNGRSVLALRGLAGKAFGATSSFSLPPDQRFYGGGSGTVRGYRFQSIGPQFADGQPVGGTGILAATIEFRQRVGEHWGFTLFSDAGRVSAANSQSGARVGVGVGAGLLYFTSIGPIRAEIAVPAVRLPNSGSFQFYIGLGQAF